MLAGFSLHITPIRIRLESRLVSYHQWGISSGKSKADGVHGKIKPLENLDL